MVKISKCATLLDSSHLAQMIHGLVVEPCAHYVKRCHRQHHHHTADHAGT